MGTKLICGAACLVLVACSRQADTPQGALARRLSEADRVVFTHVLTNRPSLTLSNKLTKKIVQALKTSHEIPSEGLAAIKEYTLVFFSGTNQLATAQSSQTIFWIDGRPYEDTSGILEAAYLQVKSEENRSGSAF
jgi:hypothetical protein